MGTLTIRCRQPSGVQLRLANPPFGTIRLNGPPSKPEEVRALHARGRPAWFGETLVDEEWWEQWKSENRDSALRENKVIWVKGLEKGPSASLGKASFTGRAGT